MVHCGSRGLGYQVCDDYLVVMAAASDRYNIELPDRQLACAPVASPEGRRYLAAMACAANYAWANRQMIMHLTEQALLHALHISPEQLNLRLVYDVAHNIAKLETHQVAGASVEACVHRKGATRAFGPGRAEVPPDYRAVGQPVLIPGDMGTASFVCKGTDEAMSRDLRLHLPRCGPGDEPVAGPEAGQRKSHRSGAGIRRRLRAFAGSQDPR